MRRVLVCGGRKFGIITLDTPPERLEEERRRAWSERAILFETLDREHAADPIGLIIEGGALGADRMAWSWARSRGVESVSFRADWTTHGKKAGPIRNGRMLEEGRPDVVIAFKGKFGTLNMIKQAKEAGVPVIMAGWGDGA